MKKQFLSNLKSVFISSIVSFLVYAACVIFLAAAWEYNDNKFLYMYCVIAIIYSFCFYHRHMKDRLDTFAAHDKKYDIIQETKMYLKKDGKFLIIIYGICALLCELSYWIIPFTNIPMEQNPIPIICLWFFPFIATIKIPVLRSLVNLLLAIIIAVLTANIRSYAIFKEKKSNKKHN